MCSALPPDAISSRTVSPAERTDEPGKQSRLMQGGMVTEQIGYPFSDPGMNPMVEGSVPSHQ